MKYFIAFFLQKYSESPLLRLSFPAYFFLSEYILTIGKKENLQIRLFCNLDFDGHGYKK
jgi:hypothetical protein